LARIAWLFKRCLSSSTRKGTRNLKQQTLNSSCGIGNKVNARHFKLLLQFSPTSAGSQGPSSLTPNTLAIPHTLYRLCLPFPSCPHLILPLGPCCARVKLLVVVLAFTLSWSPTAATRPFAYPSAHSPCLQPRRRPSGEIKAPSLR
jgi:hypothetical protein